MGQSGPLELGVAQVAKPYRLQAGPPEPVTRGGRFDRDERVVLKGSEQRPRFRRFPLHVCSLPARSRGALSRRITGPTPPPGIPWVHSNRGHWARENTQCSRDATVENRPTSAS